MTTPVRMEKIDPKDYPFRHHIEANKHLDTDELRHMIKPIVEVIDKDYKGKEHLFCDKEQVREGKFRIPKKLQEAKDRGFNCPIKMYEADKKEEDERKENEKKSVIDNLTQRSKVFETHARDVEAQLAQTQKDFEEYRRLTEARFDKLAKMISSK